MEKYTFVVDIDGTICGAPPDRDYSRCSPIKDVIDKINDLFQSGHTIILFTARGMRSYNGDKSQIDKHVRPVLEQWLIEHNVQYTELIMSKPWGPNVFYIDDRAVRPDEFVRGEYE